MNTYNVTLKSEDRNVGSEGRTIKVDASSIAGAIGKATREFVKGLDRKQRFDMNKGLKIEALRVTTDKEEVTASAAAAEASKQGRRIVPPVLFALQLYDHEAPQS